MDWFIRLLFAPDLVQLRMTGEGNLRNQHFEPGDSVYVIRAGECEVSHDSRCIATLRRWRILRRNGRHERPVPQRHYPCQFRR